MGFLNGEISLRPRGCGFDVRLRNSTAKLGSLFNLFFNIINFGRFNQCWPHLWALGRISLLYAVTERLFIPVQFSLIHQSFIFK